VHAMKADPADESWRTEQLLARRAVLVIHGAIGDLDAVGEADDDEPVDVALASPRRDRVVAASS
jgi:hypothetical protein